MQHFQAPAHHDMAGLLRLPYFLNNSWPPHNHGYILMSWPGIWGHAPVDQKGVKLGYARRVQPDRRNGQYAVIEMVKPD